MPDQPIPTFPTRAELCRRLGITEDLPDWTQEEVIAPAPRANPGRGLHDAPHHSMPGVHRRWSQ